MSGTNPHGFFFQVLPSYDEYAEIALRREGNQYVHGGEHRAQSPMQIEEIP